MRFQTFIAPCSIIIALTSCTKTRLEQALCASGSHRRKGINWNFENQYFIELTPDTPKEQCTKKEYIYGVERRKN